jgi:hypothetical protein
MKKEREREREKGRSSLVEEERLSLLKREAEIKVEREMEVVCLLNCIMKQKLRGRRELKDDAVMMLNGKCNGKDRSLN